MIAGWLVLAFLAGNWADGDTGPAGNPGLENVLLLDVPGESLFARPGEVVTIKLDVASLTQMVNGCQALLGYNSGFWTQPMDVAPGGGPWTELIYESWAVPGDLDTAIGVNLAGPVGTMADGTVAIITMTAGSREGRTSMVFRPDPDQQYATMLSDLAGNPVWPYRIDSPSIVIDGTAPSLNVVHALQNGQELLASLGQTTDAVQGVVQIQVACSDLLAGLTANPTVTVRDSLGVPFTLTFDGESPPGVFNYEIQITAATPNGVATISVSAADRAGNQSTDTDSFRVNKNQISGNMQVATSSSANYQFTRNVTLTASSGGGVMKQWTIPIQFVNDPQSQLATGAYLITDVPQGATSLSAKTAWTLRRRLPVVLGSTGQVSAQFIKSAGKDLLGGDLDQSNTVNLPDYSIMKSQWNTTGPEADINGDGQVQLLDYSLMKGNWLTAGDPP